MRIFHRLLAASLLAWLPGCSSSVPTPPTSPSVPVLQSYVVSGTVSETVNGVSRPAAGRKVDIYYESPCVDGRPNCLTDTAEVVETDQSGRYTVQVTPLRKSPVFVAGAGLHARGQQPCLASALVDKDTTIDVEFFPVDGALTPPQSASPMIAGFVYETTPQGRKPVKGYWVTLQVGYVDYWPVAKVQTDDAGRFFFCRVNRQVQMFVSEVTFIPGTDDMYFEIEVKR